MYYSAGNYEAFATPQKPANVDGKSAYIVGSAWRRCLRRAISSAMPR